MCSCDEPSFRSSRLETSCCIEIVSAVKVVEFQNTGASPIIWDDRADCQLAPRDWGAHGNNYAWKRNRCGAPRVGARFLLIYVPPLFPGPLQYQFCEECLPNPKWRQPQRLRIGRQFVLFELCRLGNSGQLDHASCRRGPWMARIMISWGLVSAATVFVVGPRSFNRLRLCLEGAEAKFLPGVILYLTYWFPERTRGQIVGLSYLGAPLALIFSILLSGLLLPGIDGVTDLSGWKWMFLVEGGLIALVGFRALRNLDDKPTDAKCIDQDERDALTASIEAEQRGRARHGPHSLPGTSGEPRVLLFAAVHFLIQMSVSRVIFYLPTQVAGLLGTKPGLKVGFVSAVPWICAMMATSCLPRLAERHGGTVRLQPSSLPCTTSLFQRSADPRSLSSASTSQRESSLLSSRYSGPAQRDR